MSYQHIIEDQRQRNDEQREGIVIPLNLPEFEIVSQEWQADGKIEVHVKARTDRQECPH